MQVTVRVRNDVLAQLAAIAQCGRGRSVADCLLVATARSPEFAGGKRGARKKQEATKLPLRNYIRLMREIRSEVGTMGIYHSHPTEITNLRLATSSALIIPTWPTSSCLPILAPAARASFRNP